MASPAVPIQSLVSPDENYKIANHRDFRNVTVTGHYDPANQMLIRDEQDAQNDPGWWLVTPMILPDGSAVAVNRGFVPLTLGENGLLANDENGPLPQYAPPKGTVTVTGLIFPTENRERGSLRPGHRPPPHPVAGGPVPVAAPGALRPVPGLREPGVVPAGPVGGLPRARPATVAG